ncbi:MAG: hypothetical protein O3A46_07985 [Candidatus Poribacteria bacterium]|nr:hypothetical protein [Candidatus Poribacteria bacterium]
MIRSIPTERSVEAVADHPRRRILYVRAPGFFVTDPTVPTLVVRDGLVLDGTPDVWEQGVTVGMPVRKASRLASAVVLPVDEGAVRDRWRALWDAAFAHTPAVETTDLHEGYLDLTGCLSPGERLADRAERLRGEIADAIGLTPRIGGGSTTFDARASAPEDFVPSGMNAERRHRDRIPLSVCADIPPKTLDRIARLGLRTLGDLHRESVDSIRRQLGRDDGVKLHRIAHSVEVRPVVANYPLKNITHTVAFPPLNDESAVSAHLRDLIDAANDDAAQAAARSEAPAALRLSLESFRGRVLDAEFVVSRKGMTANARRYRLERMLWELWDGRELERLTVTLEGLRPVLSEQPSLWIDLGGEKDRERSRAVVGEMLELVCARYGDDAATTADDPALTGIDPCFASQVVNASGLCPSGTGWY